MECASAKDILVQLETSEIVALKDLYANYQKDYPHIYSFLKTTLKWRTTHPEYITVYAVQGYWRSHGTFIAVLTFSCYDIILFSLDESGAKLYNALTQTKQIDWGNSGALFYATHEKFKPIILQAMNDINVRFNKAAVTNLWQLSENEAVQLCDTYEHENFYMDEIKPEDAEIINEVWPPRYDGSVEYLRTSITMNGGFGIYEKGSDKLVSWVLINVMGQLGVLQTRNGYFKNGFGTALIRKAAKIIGQNGDHPIGTVHDGNLPSEGLFTKLGFVKKYPCVYIRLKKNTP